MLKIAKCWCTMLLLLLFPALLYAQTTNPAPVPAPITNAKTVFIANQGADATSETAFKRAGQINEPYNSVYKAIAAWGHYRIVPSPDGADLIFEIRFTATMTDCGKVTSYAPQLDLTILDGKTHVALWVLTEPVKGAFRKTTWEKNYNDGITGMVSQLETLVAQPIH